MWTVGLLGPVILCARASSARSVIKGFRMCARTHPPPPDSIRYPTRRTDRGRLTGHNPPPRSKDSKSCAIPADIHQTTTPCASQINFDTLSGLILQVGPCRLKSSPLSVSQDPQRTLQRTPVRGSSRAIQSNPIRPGQEQPPPPPPPTTTTTKDDIGHPRNEVRLRMYVRTCVRPPAS